MLKPMNGRVLVTVDDEKETVTASGLTITNPRDDSRVRKGVVMFSNEEDPLVGKTVFYAVDKAMEITHGGETVAVLERTDILAVEEDG